MLLGGRMFSHRKKNLLIEKTERQAFVFGDELALSLELNEVRCDSLFEYLTYIRDDPGNLWIIHQRLLTQDGKCDEYVLRFRTRSWSSMARPIVGTRFMRKIFWRLAERFWGTLPTIQIGGNVALYPGLEILLETVVSLQTMKSIKIIGE